jgi:hypothetical protein
MVLPEHCAWPERQALVQLGMQESLEQVSPLGQGLVTHP